MADIILVFEVWRIIVCVLSGIWIAILIGIEIQATKTGSVLEARAVAWLSLLVVSCEMEFPCFYTCCKIYWFEQLGYIQSDVNCFVQQAGENLPLASVFGYKVHL